MIYIIMSESFIKIEPLQHLSLSLGLINQRGQFFSGHVVRAENWGLDKNPQQWDILCGGLRGQSFPFQGLKYTANRYWCDGKAQENA